MPDLDIEAPLKTMLFDRIERETGTRLHEHRAAELHRLISLFERESGTISHGPTELLSIDKDRFIDLCSRSLTVGETYFFREPSFLEAVEKKILPALVRRVESGEQQQINIWVPSCCTGEDPYTLAMLVREAGLVERGIEVKIRASDLNPQFIEKARTGIYREWSFRRTPEHFREAWFEKVDAQHSRLKGEIKGMVEFSVHNLLEEPREFSQASVDLIFCRNVFIYFTPETISGILDTFHRASREKASLVVAAAETSIIAHRHFAAVSARHSTYFRHGNDPAAFEPGEVVEETDHQVPVSTLETEPSQLNDRPSLSELSDDFADRNPQGEMVDTVATWEEGGWIELELAEDFYQKGDVSRAGSHAERAVNLMPEGSLDQYRARLLQARIFSDGGNRQQALEVLGQLTSSNKENPEAYLVLGAVYTELGRTEKAIAEYRKALYLDPDIVIVNYFLWNLFRRAGDEPASERYGRQTLRLLDEMNENEHIPWSNGMSAGSLKDVLPVIPKGATLH